MCYACKQCGKCQPPQPVLEDGEKACPICRKVFDETIAVCPHCGFVYPLPPGLDSERGE